MPKRAEWGGAEQAAERLVGGVILSTDRLTAAHGRQKLGPRKGSADPFCRSAVRPLWARESRGPKEKVRATPAPDPEGVAPFWAGGRRIGVRPPGFDPFRVAVLGGAHSGGVAPGYCIDPLRGSWIGSAEDVLGVHKALKSGCGIAALLRNVPPEGCQPVRIGAAKS
jgi:hypothetical protein